MRLSTGPLRLGNPAGLLGHLGKHHITPPETKRAILTSLAFARIPKKSSITRSISGFAMSGRACFPRVW